MNKVAAIVCTLLLSTLSFNSFSGLVVIVNPDFNAELDVADVRKYFLGKSHQLPNGKKVQLFDLPIGDDNRDAFRKQVLKKSESRLNTHWAKMLFSSKAQLPTVAKNVDELKEIISQNSNAIGYMDSVDVDGSVKVILSLD
ncbi:MAG: phosphate ABC transporter substrate-binding protein [Pseudomonadales bacterium]|nr:phosphate ABC transporter substrate-binding protein [Pseudomonadales bacterium]